MKLIDFSKDSKLNNLREKMNAELFAYDSNFVWKKTEFSAELDEYGEVEIPFELLTIEDDKTITLAGRRVLVYIRDQHVRYYPYKFHIANCATLVDYQNSGRFEKYVASVRTDGTFRINILYENGTVVKDKYEDLDVCKNCLSALNYKGVNQSIKRKRKVFESFDLDEFFQLYNRQNITIPKKTAVTAPINTYPEKEWSKISLEYRKLKNFTCEECFLDLRFDPKLLEVHHINGLKNQSGYENLKALCIRCHANQPGHGHLFATSNYREFMNKYHI